MSDFHAAPVSGRPALPAQPSVPRAAAHAPGAGRLQRSAYREYTPPPSYPARPAGWRPPDSAARKARSSRICPKPVAAAGAVCPRSTAGCPEQIPPHACSCPIFPAPPPRKLQSPACRAHPAGRDCAQHGVLRNKSAGRHRYKRPRCEQVAQLKQSVFKRAVAVYGNRHGRRARARDAAHRFARGRGDASREHRHSKYSGQFAVRLWYENVLVRQVEKLRRFGQRAAQCARHAPDAAGRAEIKHASRLMHCHSSPRRRLWENARRAVFFSYCITAGTARQSIQTSVA